MPPAHILNAPTKLMAELGYGGLPVRPDDRGRLLRPGLFPRGHGAARFYPPKGEGIEGRIRERLDRWAALRAKKGG